MGNSGESTELLCSYRARNIWEGVNEARSCFPFSAQNSIESKTGKYGMVVFLLSKQHWQIE